MWLAFYNPKALGDVLLLTSGNLEDDFVSSTTKGEVTVIQDRRNDEVKGINLFNQQEKLNLDGQGNIPLSSKQQALVNQMIAEAGFDIQISVDNSPKLVVGYVEKCEAHKDSDRLSITETRVSEDEVLPIVCGASNVQQGQKVLVAKPGAVMDDGMIIWPGKLRGAASYGMICSTDELNLTHLSDEDGIWVLDDQFEVGQPLAAVVATLNH